MTEATAALTRLNASPPVLTSLEALAPQLLRAESLASSRIEGLDVSHRRLAQADFLGSAAHDTKAAEVVGNIAALKRAIEIGAGAGRFTVGDITDIHQTLLRHSLDRGIAGVIRTKQNWIGRNPYTPEGADFVPPPPGSIPELLDDLCRYMNRGDLPALVQAGIAHAQFETIHPFADGNGRVGRCLLHLVLKRRGLAPSYVPPISLVLGANRDQYIQGLVDFREGRTDDWVEALCDATRGASTAAEGLAGAIARLQAAWVEALGKPRRDSAVYALIGALPANPVINVGNAEAIAGVSDVAAGRALNALAGAGILAPAGDRRRGRTWECRPLFDLVDDFERALLTQLPFSV